MPKYSLLILFALGACTYNTTDPAALQEVRAQQQTLQSEQAQTTERMNELEKKQAEQDGKIRVMWTHGK